MWELLAIFGLTPKKIISFFLIIGFLMIFGVWFSLNRCQQTCPVKTTTAPTAEVEQPQKAIPEMRSFWPKASDNANKIAYCYRNRYDFDHNQNAVTNEKEAVDLSQFYGCKTADLTSNDTEQQFDSAP